MTGDLAARPPSDPPAPSDPGPPSAAPLALLGVRHHGPGSARAVRAALDHYAPLAVLVEGPPEADAVLGVAADEGLRPPVALLAHVPGQPARSAFWPFAEFSPEWVAIRWAVEHEVPVHFIDLPAAHSLALEDPAEPDKPDEPEDQGDAPGGPADGPEDLSPAGPEGGADAAGAGGPDGGAVPDGPGAAAGGPEAGRAVSARAVRIDPVAALAEAAGYDDPERWWEDAVEHRTADGGDPLALFGALAEAMGALRERYGLGGRDGDAVREAHMRLRIREAVRRHERTAVVCGAWHVPALARPAPVAADRAALKGLPKVKAEVTWVPWTYRRLGRASGYGAGIDSPGWYGHLFGCPDQPVARWMAKVAALLRAEDRPVSPGHVIEAVRLAEALAALRGRPLAGLREADDAVRAVLCEGSDLPMALIRDRLVVGDALGRVPESAPAVPLARDLAREQRALRLRPEPGEREVDLDLREETGVARSRLLHRLLLLDVAWGRPAPARAGGTGTFRELWRLCWEPELSVRIAEAGGWGTTVAGAATARAREAARSAGTLAEVTALAERCLLAGLSDALPAVMRALADRAALDADVGHLAGALPALVRSVRYGDVRGTDSAALRQVAEGIATRICVGLPPACTGLDDDGAAASRGLLDVVHAAIRLLAPRPADPLRERWAGVLRSLAGRDGGVPGLIRGRAARLLREDARLDADEAARMMALALSAGAAPRDAAGWVEGFLAGGGLLLVHDDQLLRLVDGWLCSVPEEAFTEVLPLLRRTFGAFDSGVRRAVGEVVRRGLSWRAGVTAGASGFGAGLDRERADAALPTLRLLLGAPPAAAAGGPEPAPREEPEREPPDRSGDRSGEGSARDGDR